MMLFGFSEGGIELELRARGGGGGRGGARLSGRFPYERRAVISDGGRSGRPKKEVFKKGAFRHSVKSKTQEIHLLSGHDFSKALASKLNGSLIITDTDDSLSFIAELTEEMLETSHAKDMLNMLHSGLIGGVSPGFRIPPSRVNALAETVVEENPAEGNALIREIHDAILYEISLVTRPAYSETEILARSWDVSREVVQSTARRNPYRWR